MPEIPSRQSLATEISAEDDVIHANLQPLERFLIALRAPETKRQYPKRLESFLYELEIKPDYAKLVIDKLDALTNIAK